MPLKNPWASWSEGFLLLKNGSRNEHDGVSREKAVEKAFSVKMG